MNLVPSLIDFYNSKSSNPISTTKNGCRMRIWRILLDIVAGSWLFDFFLSKATDCADATVVTRTFIFLPDSSQMLAQFVSQRRLMKKRLRILPTVDYHHQYGGGMVNRVPLPLYVRWQFFFFGFNCAMILFFWECICTHLRKGENCALGLLRFKAQILPFNSPNREWRHRCMCMCVHCLLWFGGKPCQRLSIEDGGCSVALLHEKFLRWSPMRKMRWWSRLIH